MSRVNNAMNFILARNLADFDKVMNKLMVAKQTKSSLILSATDVRALIWALQALKMDGKMGKNRQTLDEFVQAVARALHDLKEQQSGEEDDKS